MNRILERRQRLLLASVATRHPRTTEAIRNLPEVCLWTDSAYESTLDIVIGRGHLVESPTGRPFVAGGAR